ncbi:MAG: glycosyl hydrolase family 28 protein [Sedimentisphaerales bacterium]
MRCNKLVLPVTILLASCTVLFTAEQESSKPAKRYVITNYGAVTEPNIINTKAIQDAIDKCAADGGGTVVIPAGTFITGAVFFKQGVNLEIEADGVLKGTTNMADYKLIQTRWEGEERMWVSVLVNVFDVNGFRMTGKGIIDGSGDIFRTSVSGRGAFGGGFGGFRGTRGVQSDSVNNVGPVRKGPPSLGPEGGLHPAPDSPAYEMHEVDLPTYARPRLIAIQNCNDVVVENLKFKNQASWCLFVLYSKKVEIRNLVIRAEHTIPSSDGIDIDSCDGVHIIGVDIDVNDDCIAIKSGKDEDGRRVNRPVENVLVEKSIFRYGHGGVSMGSEMSGGIRNIEIRDSVMEEDNWAPIRFKFELKNTRKAFEFNMAWRMVNPKPPSDPLPVVRNVKIINVSGTTDNVGDMYGLPDSPITNVTFENCNIKAQRGFTLENVENLDLSGLKIEVQQGEPIIHRNAQ